MPQIYTMSLFIRLIIRLFSLFFQSEQYFSLTTNQPIVFFLPAYQHNRTRPMWQKTKRNQCPTNKSIRLATLFLSYRTSFLMD
jgi:nucleoside recognition membrane protein YjiH